MAQLINFEGKSIEEAFEDLGLLEYYPGKITIEIANAMSRKRVGDAKDIPWVFLENVINPEYSGRSVFFTGQDTTHEPFAESYSVDDDLGWGDDVDESTSVSYSYLDLSIIVFLCCDNQCKKILASMLHKSELSAPLILPNMTDEDGMSVQLPVLRGITEDVGFDTHIPIVSFVCVNGDPIVKTNILNTLFNYDEYNPFFDRNLELARMGNVACTELFQSGGIETALSRPYFDCICHNPNACACMITKNVLFLNLYGLSGHFKKQEDLVLQLSTLVTIVVDTGKLAGDSAALNDIKGIISKSKQTFLVFTKDNGVSLDHCKQGVKQLKEIVSGSGAQVAVLYDRSTGKRDNNDKIRGHLRKQVNSILNSADSDTSSLMKMFENLDIDHVEMEGR